MLTQSRFCSLPAELVNPNGARLIKMRTDVCDLLVQQRSRSRLEELGDHGIIQNDQAGLCSCTLQRFPFSRRSLGGGGFLILTS